eukprot:361944-Chlamydomonas_euryale.AAC.4
MPYRAHRVHTLDGWCAWLCPPPGVCVCIFARLTRRHLPPPPHPTHAPSRAAPAHEAPARD